MSKHLDPPQTRSRRSSRSRSLKIPSSWISKVSYKNGFLVIFLADRPDEALLYANVPEWMPGLIQAGEGGRSVGSAYNSLLKKGETREKYGIQYQRIEGRDKVWELRRMMK